MVHALDGSQSGRSVRAFSVIKTVCYRLLLSQSSQLCTVRARIEKEEVAAAKRGQSSCWLASAPQVSLSCGCAWCVMLFTTSRALLDLSLINDAMLLLGAQGVAGLVVLPSSSKLTMNQRAPAGNNKALGAVQL